MSSSSLQEKTSQKRKRSSSDAVDISNIILQRTRGPLQKPSFGYVQEHSARALLVAQLIETGISWDELVREWKMRQCASGSEHRFRHSPSELTAYSAWHEHQKGNDPTYLCYRPPHAVPDVPVPLLLEPLSRFSVNMKTIALTDEDLSVAQKFLDDIHSEEYVRDHKNKVYDMVKDIDRYCYDGHATVIANYSLSHGITMDGAGIKRAPCLFLDYKAEQGKLGDPFFQFLNYALRVDDESRQVELQTYGVAICILGAEILALALTVVGKKVWAEPLGIVQCYGRFKVLEATARVWKSVRQLLCDYEPVKKFSSKPVPWPLRDCQDLDRPDAMKLLYTYINEQGKTEVAKFVESYSEEAHRAWMSFAPELRHIDNIAGGEWILVRMESLSEHMGWLPAAEVLKGVRNDQQHFTKVKSCIVEMVEKGHSQDFVHGDMRLPNILLHRSPDNDQDGFPKYEARLLDFDWSGKSGHARYPRRLSRQINWPPGATYGGLPTTFWNSSSDECVHGGYGPLILRDVPFITLHLVIRLMILLPTSAVCLCTGMGLIFECF